MKRLFYCLLVLLAAGCKEKYDLPFSSPATGYLVIEGVLTTGPDSTHIELSRTNKINATQKQYEDKALVQVEGDDNSTQILPQTSSGVYSTALALKNTGKYRLRIKTMAGKEYLSDFAAVKTTPAIDSISWQRTADGVRLFFNTHDPTNNTRYYLWNYLETWEFHSAFQSFLKYDSKMLPNGSSTSTVSFLDPISNLPDSTVYKCWSNASSTNILIGSSVKLTNDVIYQQPFLLIPKADRRISVLYSINVKQYGLTKDAYEFLDKMKKNTEGTGSIFDPQPSQLNGNISCVSDPAEPVIGFISIASLQEKRVFISNSQVPLWGFSNLCQEDVVKNIPDSIAVAQGVGQVPTAPLEMNGLSIVTFGASNPACVNCTLSGSNVKPGFWP
ncbi:DUF4249 domain-containing protein [soil metagenome]